MTVYAGTHFGGILKSTDGGVTWSAANTGLTDFYDFYVPALLIDPMMPATLYAGTWNGVFKSIDGAATWLPAKVGLTTRYVATLALDPLNPSILFAGTLGGGIFRSYGRALSSDEISSLASR